VRVPEEPSAGLAMRKFEEAVAKATKREEEREKRGW
jgi:hypothetical protein